VNTTLFVDSDVIVPNCFHACPLLVHNSPQQKMDIRNEKQFTGAAHKKYVQQEEDLSGNNLEQ
jgi:hypothetical protein